MAAINIRNTEASPHPAQLPAPPTYCSDESASIISASTFSLIYSFGVGPNAFALSSKGDETYIYSGDGTNLTGYLQGYAFGAAENGVSFGRYVTSTGGIDYPAMSARTSWIL